MESGQLLSLLNATATGPGGTIKFISAGGDILVDGATVRADRGTVDFRNNGASGVINLSNASLRGDVVKVGTFGRDGQLIIGGGTIDANSAIKLYAPGSNGSVRFTNNVALTGNSVKTIAGNTVQIDNGRVVTVGGGQPANVFTNKANFLNTQNPNFSSSGGNNSTTGRFGGAGAVTKPLSSKPAF